MNLKLMIALLATLAMTVGFSYKSHYFEYTYSEEFFVNHDQYNRMMDDNKSQSDCDFLNLCSSHINKIMSDVSSPYAHKIVDISYVDLYVDLPFP